MCLFGRKIVLFHHMLLVVKTAQRQRDSSVGKELAVPSRGPEFHPQDPDEEAMIPCGGAQRQADPRGSPVS